MGRVWSNAYVPKGNRTLELTGRYLNRLPEKSSRRSMQALGLDLPM
jgi:hypothetical protein